MLANGVFELKTPRGFRILYFFRAGRIVVCTGVCRKPKPRELATLVRRAQRVRDEFAAAFASGSVVIERGA